MFATFTIERDPLTLADLPAGFGNWLQVTGGYAMFGVCLWLLIGLTRLRPSDRARIPRWQAIVFGTAFLAALLGYLLLLVPRLGSIAQLDKLPLKPWENNVFSFASGCALFAAFLPFVLNLASSRSRRIFAIAKLSFKEAIRRRVLYAFTALLLVFLFASWFLPSKPEDQVRNYVQVVYWAMTPLLLFTAAFLAGFSIPTDIRQLTIHTVVTKPVEKFEIVLGRFLGFTALMTLVLVLMTGISLLYVLRGVGPDAAAESLKARVPVYGELYFDDAGTSKRRGESVGHEWEYRSYITAKNPGQDPSFACWGFVPISGPALNREQVRCEFTFDIYRTTKGVENRGVSCFFTFHTGKYDRDRENAYRERRETERRKPDAAADNVLDAKLAEEFGFFEVPSKAITDYHTQFIDIPAALFRHPAASKIDPGQTEDPALMPVHVRVMCNSRTQYVGMAKHDLYFRLDNPDGSADTALFAANFFKGSLGLWFRLCLVTGIAVCLSTYLSGVISMVLTLMLYLGGLCQEFIQSVATGKNIGGGPAEALKRLVGREHITAPLDDTTSQRVVVFSDDIFRWFIRRVLDLLPDVDRFDLSDHVAEGFNISGAQLGMDGLLLLGYLVPWFVLAYFIMKWREIATW